jgi:hypothetical protein
VSSTTTTQTVTTCVNEPPTCTATGERVVNGGFETALSNGWTVSSSNNLNNANSGAISGNQQSGARAYRARFNAGGGDENSGGSVTLTQRVTVCAGTTYNVSAWNKQDIPDVCSATYRVDGQTMQNVNPGTAYGQTSFVVTPTSLEMVLDIVLSCSQGGQNNEIFLDTVSATSV